MRRLAEQKKTVEQWRSLEKNTVDIGEMIDLATAESDDSFTGEIRTDIENLAVTMDKLELELAFSGEYDSRNSRRGRRYRVPGLGRDAAADVPALGRETRL
jgi:peptide chain release factor 2